MYRPWLSLTLALVVTIFLSACTTQAPPTPISTITSNSSTQLNIKSANRIVALSSLSADIIAQLDQTKLVGISGSSLFKNDSRFQAIPKVSEGQSPPNLEKIVSLKPDLVIGAAGFSDPILQKLNQLQIPTVSTKINSWQSLEAFTKQIAQAMNVDSAPLLKRYQSLIASKNSRNLSTLVLVSRQPILTPNKNSWAGDLLTQFGAKNVAADLQGKSPIGGYVTLSAERILAANPDILIVVNAEPTLLDSLKKESFWNRLKATKNNQVYVFDYYGLVNPGSLEAIEKACSQLKDILTKQ
ncbi:ABC transporter substrate-binding protein [Richelia sinica]|uniref:ABC transporter substrate-binding protein n=1 Tax=Richelia sinica TaxID=1357545 RepID=UPI001682CC22|nr:ABC transporter substrate-binding protein [Richelia sinica]MBD2667143.1 ABC transporter substrate-binding protein [Richelia sinica FACHB-800]